MRAVIVSLIILAGLLLAATGCTPAEKGPGTINVVVTSTIVEQDVSGSGTDIEISNITATISGVKVSSGGITPGDRNGQGKWVDLYVASKPLNLLQNSGQEHFIAFADVAPTSYDEIVMFIDRLNVTLDNGSKITITPNEPFDFMASFAVFAEKTTTVIFKFNIDKSVTYTDEDKATIKPLASIILNVRYEEIE
jgi:hypothetical protein